MSSPIASTTVAPPFPTTSRELRPRSQSRALSNNSSSKSSKLKTKVAAATSRRTRSQSMLSLSTSEPRFQTDVNEASGSASGSGSASASLSRQSPDDVGSLVIESTLAEVRDAVAERPLVLDEDAGPSSSIIGVSSRGGAESSRSRKRRRIDSSGSGSDDGAYELVETSGPGDRDREMQREYSHPPIACLTAAPPTASPNAGLARIRELISRRGAKGATTSPTSPLRQPAPSSSSSHPSFTSGEDPFVSDSIPAPLPSTSTSTSTSSQPISSSSPITVTSAPSTTAPPLSTYTCPICFSPPTNATLTPCGHVCCGVCLFTAVKATLQRGALMAGGGAAEGNFPRWVFVPCFVLCLSFMGTFFFFGGEKGLWAWR
jgi:hypothetical protein